MAYSKPTTNELLASQLVTLKDLSAMSNFIQQFKLKYSRRRKLVKKKP